MKIFEFTAALKNKMGDNLVSLVQFGSSVSKEESRVFSNIDCLIIAKHWSRQDLVDCEPIFSRWKKAGHPLPYLWTQLELQTSLDVFPLDFLRIQTHYEILAGENIFQKINIEDSYLRHQLEYELRGKLLQLRSRYVESLHTANLVKELLGKSVASFTAFFWGVIYILEKEKVMSVAEIWKKMSGLATFDVTLFDQLMAVKNGAALTQHETDNLFDLYLKAIENVVTLLDRS